MAERLNRNAVVERAAELADEFGLAEVTITKLGRALGIAPPGVYRHVTDVDDLRAAVGQRAATEVAGVLAADCAGLSGRDALAALADSLRSWASAHPGRYAALQIAPDPDDVAGQSSADELIAVFASVLRAYELSGDDLTDAIRLIRSGLHGFVALERDGGFKQERSVDATFARLVDSFDVTLRSWAN
ncbi:TetR/AcrR family transcriptional regulator [Epidermidibacterium keratini]|uniref:TetR/AcrR family transcriptional regulator n=1 Tax=Epidermidibacterium keratini TaxID=1891644 RepID=A0A7L4YRK2_9ACTN|nr:TetR-like C-terminal domain-containing protein [Epidermidibacterium keratini]QHC01197.1 TetR/AcrR family transcriptional regulator [Epidermidibacterium keratini]